MEFRNTGTHIRSIAVGLELTTSAITSAVESQQAEVVPGANGRQSNGNLTVTDLLKDTSTSVTRANNMINSKR